MLRNCAGDDPYYCISEEVSVAAGSIVKTENTFVDERGITVYYYTWKAVKPRAVLQLAHGLGDHANRYERLAIALAEAGISVYADDHRGHGKTGLVQNGGDHSKLGKLGDGGLRAQVADLHQFRGIIASENPGLPIAFLGHSWGSLLGQMLLNEYPNDYDAVVLTGTAYRVPTQMNGGQLNAKHKHLGTTGYEWLSRDPAVANAFLADPLTFYADALKIFGVPDGLRLYGRPRSPLGKDLPLLIMIGGEDSLGGEESVRKLADSYVNRGGLTDVEVVVYTEARHEIFNETNKEEVTADLLAWLEGRLGLPQLPA
jgi:alpha-beta hydrolase superfamily lysophospholipase